MENTSVVSAIIDNDIKEKVDKILTNYGLSSSKLIQILYSQIVLNGDIPFDINKKTIIESELTEDELVNEIMKGVDDVNNGRIFSEDDVEINFYKKLGL